MTLQDLLFYASELLVVDQWHYEVWEQVYLLPPLLHLNKQNTSITQHKNKKGKINLHAGLVLVQEKQEIKLNYQRLNINLPAIYTLKIKF